MKKILLALFLIIPKVNYAVYEDELKEDLIENQRKYSSKHIYEMIKNVQINEHQCNVEIQKRLVSFLIKQGEHSYEFKNIVRFGKKMRTASSYDCILSSNKFKLECSRYLFKKTNSLYEPTIIIYTTIHLDENANATSIEGRKVTEFNTLGFRIDKLDKVYSKFKCNIEIPAKIKNISIVNKGRREKIDKNRHFTLDSAKVKSGINRVKSE